RGGPAGRTVLSGLSIQVLAAEATLRIERIALAGGGLEDSVGADLALVDSEISGVTGIAVVIGGGVTVISRSGIHDNHSSGILCVGAIWIQAGSVRIENSTISDNSCDTQKSGGPGAILLAQGSLSLAFTTVASNRGYGAIAVGPGANLRIKASVL